jgi:DNA primase
VCALAAGDVEIAGRRLAIRNLDRVIFPRAGTTKAQVLDYYVRVAEVMLPHLRGRDHGDPSRLVFELDQVLRRVERHGDLFAGVLSDQQSLTGGLHGSAST